MSALVSYSMLSCVCVYVTAVHSLPVNTSNHLNVSPLSCVLYTTSHSGRSSQSAAESSVYEINACQKARTHIIRLRLAVLTAPCDLCKW